MWDQNKKKMKKYIFVVMFLLGIGNVAYSQNRTEEKVLAEYQLPFFPVVNSVGQSMLHCIFISNKKLEKFLIENINIWKLDAEANHIVVLEEVAIMKGSRKTKQFLRLKEVITEHYPKVVDSVYYEIPCYSKAVDLGKGKFGVEVYCVEGELAFNADVQVILSGLFNPEKTINAGLRFVVTLKDKTPNEKDMSLKRFSLQSVTYQTCPNVIKKD